MDIYKILFVCMSMLVHIEMSINVFCALSIATKVLLLYAVYFALDKQT